MGRFRCVRTARTPGARLFGRATELAEIRRLLVCDGVRLLTLTGPGGTGKTRLAETVVAEPLPSPLSSAYYVDLSAITDAAAIPSMIAEALGVQEAGSAPLPSILHSVIGRSPLLLVLDNFERVMGAQLTISGINTLLTAIFAAAIGLKYFPLVVGLTFVCGLLPIVGNLISNSVIVGIAFTSSAKAAIAALIFLVVLHKLEYFLNARIVGSEIKARAWELLLAMLVMEAAFGMAGLIAAPIYYAYLKEELAARGLI